ncbi:MAG TPA: hypothetical protein PK659_06685 [Methanothrix sp.]|nr:DUF3226 domain-containing protein [Methanothrix sp.]HOK58355.1 hypothetical protein [Methanothrix sp.]HOL43920.1 hypothetical protein [Methanothrix sp.]HPO88442.1 hypothetical protein [Methanothrix sp.]
MMAVWAERIERIECSNVIVVEGKEDKLFFEALIRHLELQNIQVISSEGKDNFRIKLKAVMNLPGSYEIESIAIVRDGDANPESAFQSVCDALRNAGLPVPAHPGAFVGDKPRAAVLILPGPDAPGMLEDLCLKAVAEDPAMRCTAEYFECLRRNCLYFSGNVAKAKIQVFLASRERAGLRLGEAAQAGYLPWDADAFRPVRDFLKQISGDGV